ncbi:MAG: hypothetical protein HYY58_04615 [Candidatus Omnitrophica bacterium]|nr:hypothetical protein [Candidatus Omnitrophota bacterium]
MDRRWIVGVLGCGVSLCLGTSTSLAADGDSAAEAATTESALEGAGHEQILATIEETRKTDPELAQEMEQQLKLLESGELNLHDLETAERSLALGAPAGIGELPGGGQIGPPGPPVETGLLGPPVWVGTGGDDNLPPGAKKELEELFKQGTGDPNSEKDRELREKAGEILEKYGVDPREIGTGREGHDGTSREGIMNNPREAFEQWERSEQGRNTDPAMVEQYREQAEQYQAEFERGGGFERAMEQMSPEAREQMERHFGQEREMSGQGQGTERERESSGPARESEAPTREHEAAAREYEAPTREHEAMTREYEAQTREYEAPSREVETVTRDYEAPTREYEAPTHEAEMPSREYEAPTPEYQAPERTYEAPPQYEGTPH